jgi:hypothetical protein
MSSTLTVLIAKLQAQLLDSGALFTTPTCTVAFREALRKWNMAAPVHSATLIDIVADAKEYVLNDPTIVNLLDIESAWLKAASGEDDTRLNYDFYFEDNAPVIRLRDALQSGTLIVRYTSPHYIVGLDNAATGILTADQEQVLIDGACVEAINIRLTSTIEGFNLSDHVVEEYKRAAGLYVLAFAAGLQRYARQRSAVGAKSTCAWNDEWHEWLR